MGSNMRRGDRYCILDEDEDDEEVPDACLGRLSYYVRKLKKFLHDSVPYIIIGIIAVFVAFFTQSHYHSRSIRNLYSNISDLREALNSRLEDIDKVLTKLAISCRSSLSEEYEDPTEEIIKKSIRKYDADKTGMMDWALESLGGKIFSVKGTESYVLGSTTVLGIPCKQYSSDPATVIRPSTMPGDCWAFKGEGTIVIDLVTSIYITNFTLEHIPKEITPEGEISSAPKIFIAWGTAEETPNGSKHCFGQFEYKSTGDPVQTFPVQFPSYNTYDKVEFNFKTNHGNRDFTCVYRIRVHGQLNMENMS